MEAQPTASEKVQTRYIPLMQYKALPCLLQHCQAQPWHLLRPRVDMDLERWAETWADQLSRLHEFSSHGYYGLDVQDLDADSQRAARAGWCRAALQSLALLDLAYSRGLPPRAMESLFEHVLHWCNEYAVFMRSDAATPAQARQPINPASNSYPAAVQLLALPVLLERQELIPGIVERLLGNRCDCLLDYLSAVACEKDEASAQVFCPKPYADLGEFFEQSEMGTEPLQHYLAENYSSQLHPALAAIGRLIGMGEHHPRWAWEVAALVVLYELDDSPLTAYSCYPADMVALARQRLAVNEASFAAH